MRKTTQPYERRKYINHITVGVLDLFVAVDHFMFCHPSRSCNAGAQNLENIQRSMTSEAIIRGASCSHVEVSKNQQDSPKAS